MALISWTDSLGSAVLANIPGRPNRFDGWRPDVELIGPSSVRLGSGITDMFEFRRDDVVEFEIANIATEANYEKMIRLKAHLMRGGGVTLSTGNILASTFANSILAPGTVPKIDYSDRTTMEYTFRVELKSGLGAPGGTGDVAESVFRPPVTGEANLELWVRAKAMLGDVDDADHVGRWPDLSGNGNDLEQADDDLWLQYQIVSGSGPVVRSISPRGPMFSPMLFNPYEEGATLFVVARRNGAYRWPGDLAGFWKSDNNTANTIIRDGLFLADDDGNFHWDNAGDGSQPLFGPVTDFSVMTLILNGSVGTTRFNGEDVVVDFGVNPALDEEMKYGISNGGNDGTINAQHKEHILYRGVLPGSRIDEIETYLLADHDITP